MKIISGYLKEVKTHLPSHITTGMVTLFGSGICLLCFWGIAVPFKNWIKETTKIEFQQQLKEHWAENEFLNNIEREVIGFSYQAYFVLGGESGSTEYYIPIYITDGAKDVDLYLDATHTGTSDEEPVKIQIFLDAVEVPENINRNGSVFTRTIQLSKYVVEAKQAVDHNFDGNVHILSFRTIPSKQKTDSISIKALINVGGLAIGKKSN